MEQLSAFIQKPEFKDPEEWDREKAVDPVVRLLVCVALCRILLLESTFLVFKIDF